MSDSNGARRRRPAELRRGFTLIELLVVIGIIAVLISILLPSLAAARRSAANVKCLSNLKNLHNALLMYAGDHKNAQPVARQDYPEVNGIPQNLAISAGGLNWWWQDSLYLYLFRKSPPLAGMTDEEATAYRQSVLWCPTWSADHPELRDSQDRHKSGYGFNIYLGFRSNYPEPDAMLPLHQLAVRSNAVFTQMTTKDKVGKYYKRNELSDGGNRIIVADADLWCIGLGVTGGSGNLLGQRVTPGLEHNVAGAFNLDRYRHGKRPGHDGTRFELTGGRIKYNALFVDGHADSLDSHEAGYRGLRMRGP